MRTVLFCLMLALSSAVPAGVYKCEVNGKVTYQDRPCAGAKADENQVEIHANRTVNTGTPASAADAGNADWVAKIEQENHKRDLTAKVASLEKQKAGLSKDMDAELGHLQDRKRYAANNPGTTPVETIDTEIKSATQRYTTQIQTVQAQIDTIKAELAGPQAAPQNAPKNPPASAAQK